MTEGLPTRDEALAEAVRYLRRSCEFSGNYAVLAASQSRAWTALATSGLLPTGLPGEPVTDAPSQDETALAAVRRKWRDNPNA
mgnify:CR=1 FL=1